MALIPPPYRVRAHHRRHLKLLPPPFLCQIFQSTEKPRSSYLHLDCLMMQMSKCWLVSSSSEWCFLFFAFILSSPLFSHAISSLLEYPVASLADLFISISVNLAITSFPSPPPSRLLPTTPQMPTYRYPGFQSVDLLPLNSTPTKSASITFLSQSHAEAAQKGLDGFMLKEGAGPIQVVVVPAEAL